VGGPAATGGQFLDIWRRPLTVGAPLPALPLALTAELALPVDPNRPMRAPPQRHIWNEKHLDRWLASGKRFSRTHH